MDVHPTKNSINRYWSIATSWNNLRVCPKLGHLLMIILHHFTHWSGQQWGDHMGPPFSDKLIWHQTLLLSEILSESGEQFRFNDSAVHEFWQSDWCDKGQVRNFWCSKSMSISWDLRSGLSCQRSTRHSNLEIWSRQTDGISWMFLLRKAKPGLFHGCTFFQARVASSTGRSLTCRISTCNYMPCLAHTGNAAQSSRITRIVHLSNICHLTQLPIDRALIFWVLGYTVMSHFRTCRAACTSFGGSPAHSVGNTFLNWQYWDFCLYFLLPFHFIFRTCLDCLQKILQVKTGH